MSPHARPPARYYRTVGLVFTLGIMVGIMVDDFFSPAYAQIPDAGLQRNELKAGMEQLNAHVSDVIGILRSETLKVRVIETDKQDGPGLQRSPTMHKPGTTIRDQVGPREAGTGGAVGPPAK